MRKTKKSKQWQNRICFLTCRRVSPIRLSIAVIFMLCLVLTAQAHAQRCLPGMKGLEVRGGMVDGFHSSANRNKLGYYVGASMSVYSKHANKWVFGGEFLNRYYP